MGKQLHGCCVLEESGGRSNGQTHTGVLSLLLMCVFVCIDGTIVEKRQMLQMWSAPSFDAVNVRLTICIE